MKTSKQISLTLTVPDDAAGQLIHATTVLNCSEEDIIRECFIYGLRKVQANIPLSQSMLTSLEENEANSRILHTRIAKALLTTEKALADSLALMRTGASILASSTGQGDQQPVS
jgi:hypothetical protein